MRSRIPQLREDEIVELAEVVADEHCRSGIVCPVTILRANKVKFCYGTYGLKTFDGMLEYKNGRFFVFCNRDRGNHEGTRRSRFTLSHELAHFYIPEHRWALLNGVGAHPSVCGLFDGASVQEEVEADIFAANLLMPPSRFKAAMSKTTGTPMNRVMCLKDTFQTSILSTAVQYGRYDNNVVALLKWSNDDVEWKRILEEYFFAQQYRSWKLRSRADLPDDSATAVALAESPDTPEPTIHESVLTASFCFHHVSSSGSRDIVLREEAVRLGRHGVLTLLSVHPRFQKKVQ